MSDKKKSHKNGRNHSKNHYQGPKKSSWGWFIAIAAGIAIWSSSHTDGTSGVNHSPSNGSTVCTQYFKGGC